MMHWTRKLLAALAVAGTLTGAIALAAPDAHADAPNATAVKKKAGGNKKASFDATFDRYLVDPRGDVSGILLSNGAVVGIPRGAQPATTLKKGDAIHIEAFQKVLPDGTLYGRPIITKGTVVIVDASKWKKGEGKKGPNDPKTAKPKLAKMTITSSVASFLLDMKGRHHGVVLADGTIAYAHDDLMQLGLKKGDSVTIEGEGGSYALGRAMVVKSVKLPNGSVVTPKAPEKKAKKTK
jgi:hypothetical protein